MSKRSVYIETSYVSVLTARPSRDLLAAANQAVSAEWWDKRRSEFELLVSEFEPPVICTPIELMED